MFEDLVKEKEKTIIKFKFNLAQDYDEDVPREVLFEEIEHYKALYEEQKSRVWNDVYFAQVLKLEKEVKKLTDEVEFLQAEAEFTGEQQAQLEREYIDLVGKYVNLKSAYKRLGTPEEFEEVLNRVNVALQKAIEVQEERDLLRMQCEELTKQLNEYKEQENVKEEAVRESSLFHL